MWADILQTISVIIAAGSIAAGVTAWRRTTIGQKRIELAEETLVLFMRANDAIHDIRAIFSFGEQIKERKVSEDETPEESFIKNETYLFIQKYQKYSELFAELSTLRYRFESYFRSKAVTPFLKITRLVNLIALENTRRARYLYHLEHFPITLGHIRLRRSSFGIL
ncbi:MAG: hypothetical protein O3A96_16315, partial [Proteobacteria bacterium]|nr:hypothetical protein [Pseudomonadota bacterium]